VEAQRGLLARAERDAVAEGGGGVGEVEQDAEDVVQQRDVRWVWKEREREIGIG
jgi:uncharacterized OB-fold protein